MDTTKLDQLQALEDESVCSVREETLEGLEDMVKKEGNFLRRYLKGLDSMFSGDTKVESEKILSKERLLHDKITSIYKGMLLEQRETLKLMDDNLRYTLEEYDKVKSMLKVQRNEEK